MMSKRTWTESQLSAITHRDSDLLVAAAAGSGKTATLTERVIRRVTEENADLSRMLIVTFTKAAAEELRIRIRDALTKKSAQNPSDRSLRVKLLMLNSAQISTIHGFCSSLIKENYAALNLPSGMRIAEESEATLLKKRVMDKVIDMYFENEVPDEYRSDGFPILFDSLIKSKTAEKLSDVLISVYDTVSSSADGVKIIHKTSDNFKTVEEGGFFESVYADTAKKSLLRTVKHFIREYKSLIDSFSGDEIFSSKYVPMLTDEAEMLHKTALCCEDGNVKKALGIFCDFSFVRAPAVRGEYAFKEAVKNVRNDIKEERKKLLPYRAFTDDTLSIVAKDGRLLFECMYKLISLFCKMFEEEKRIRRFMDYGDLEQFAYRLFYDKNGNKTKKAYETSELYDEIYIDEYQDCNSLQDAIFSAISKNNRFMVGDIKQSIYSFRGAEPYLFSNYRIAFENSDNGRAIFLSNNFRCSENIIKFTNLVFAPVFSKNKDIPYKEEDELVFSKFSDTSERVTVCVIGKNENETAKETEASYIADTIAYMIENEAGEDGRPYTAGDFAILLRNAKKSAAIYEQALVKRGIPVYNGVEKNFFESSEVLLALCLISAIDNPMRDVQLAGLMQSPLFRFSLDELIEIRGKNKDIPLYSSLLEYTERTNDEKCRAFIEKLNLYRKKAQGMQTDKLIWFLYSDTGIFALLCSDGEKSEIESKRANLMMLYEYARKFEAGSFKGLYNFISYINEIIERKTKLEAVKADSDEENSVKIMTVHKSKGLEFPVCFLADACADLGKKGGNSYKYDRRCGFAVKIRDNTGFVSYKTPMYCAVSSEEHDREQEEEARILYVALTRARNKLFVTGGVDDAEKFTNGIPGGEMTEYSFYNSRSYMEMILSAAEDDVSFEKKILFGYDGIETATDAIDESIEEFDEELYNEVIKNLNYKYPYEVETTLPKKVSVSRLYPDFLDKDDDLSEIITNDIPLEFKDPDAIRREVKNTQKGIATHLFMQFCDFDSVLRLGAKEEAERLLSFGFMKREDVDFIDFASVESFFSSSSFKAIKNALACGLLVKREYRFNINLSASLFTNDDDMRKKLENEKLLVQGVIDIMFENDDGTLTLLDYKTDRINDNEREIASFVDRHKTQLQYYKIAVERITGKKVTDTVLYSFALRRDIKVDI